MNPEEFPFDAWNVEPVDLTARVDAAIDATVPPPVERQLLDELRELRRELAELRATTSLLKDEVARLRPAPALRRIAPFAPTEGLARLS